MMTTTGTTRWKRLLGAACMTFAVGCAGPSYDRTEILDVSQGDLPATVSLSLISLSVGAATRAVLKPWNDDNKLMGVGVQSDNPELLDIAPGVGDHEFMFIARKVGTTSARFLADGDVVAIARVEIRAQ